MYAFTVHSAQAIGGQNSDQPHQNRIQKGGVSLMAESLHLQGNVNAQKSKDGKYVYMWVCMLCAYVVFKDREKVRR